MIGDLPKVLNINWLFVSQISTGSSVTSDWFSLFIGPESHTPISKLAQWLVTLREGVFAAHFSPRNWKCIDLRYVGLLWSLFLIGRALLRGTI